MVFGRQTFIVCRPGPYPSFCYYSLLAFWLTLYIYSTLYFFIQTEDDRSFCRNMYLNLKSVVLFLKLFLTSVASIKMC